jgi:hypothetical protein
VRGPESNGKNRVWFEIDRLSRFDGRCPISSICWTACGVSILAISGSRVWVRTAVTSSARRTKDSATSWVRRGSARVETGGVIRGCERTERFRLRVGVRFLLRCSPTLRAELLRAAGERCSMAKDNRSGLWGAQERARKAMVHAKKVRERAKRALRVAAARERSAARHDRHAETLEAHGATRAAAAERRDAGLDREAADAERERER